ncbi:MAG: flippase-like domain-containing protein, partial [Deltaproteobacteria bacterium]|nr:flippase-like domain-containing protein [Deltaproteobacteria bacterium]
MGIGLLCALYYSGSFSSFKNIKNLNPLYFSYAFAAWSLSALVLTMRWHNILFLQTQSSKFKKNQLLQFLISGRLSGLFVPKSIGEVSVRSYSLNLSSKIETMNAFGSVMTDFLFDIGNLLMMILPASIYFIFYPSLVSSPILYLFSIVIVLACVHRHPMIFIEKIFSRLSHI